MYKTVLSCAAASIALALAPAAGAGEVPVIDSANIVTPPVPAPTAPSATSGGGAGAGGAAGTTTLPPQVASFNVNALSPPQMAQAATIIQEVLTSNSVSPRVRRALQQQLAQIQQQMGR